MQPQGVAAGGADLDSMIAEAYGRLNVFEADVIYLYSDFRWLGTLASPNQTKDDFCSKFVAPLLAREKTAIVTAFTYTVEGKFDVIKTPTTLGALNKWIHKQPGSRRSEHPLFSYSALGPGAGFVEDIGKSAFGHDSVFHRLRGRRAAFLHVGRPVAMGNTALHHIEHICGATYRLHKAFPTQVWKNERYVGSDYTAFLRRRDIPGHDFAFDFSRAATEMHARGLVRQVGDDANLSNFSFYWYDETLDFLAELFYRDQSIFLNRPFVGY